MDWSLAFFVGLFVVGVTLFIVGLFDLRCFDIEIGGKRQGSR